mgnify:CR=1 FL=1
MKLFFLFFFLLLSVAVAYVGWHIWHVLPLSKGLRWGVLAVLLACFLSMFLNFGGLTGRMPLWLGSTIYDVGFSSLIILLYLFITFLVLDLGRLVRLVPKALLYDNAITSVSILVLMVGVFVYGNLHYRHKVRETVNLTTDKPLTAKKIVMVSDLHLGYHNRRAELERWVDIINEEKADLVLVAGDIIDMSMRPLEEERMAEVFHRLNAPIYACLGNHEYFSGEPAAQRFYDEAGIHLLRDTAQVVGDLCIVGRDDRTNRHRRSLADIMQGADRSKFTILLDHQPYHLEEAEQQGIDFQFSGHTHRGQVWPISWITDAVYECSFGPWQRGDTHYYISSGIGLWGGKYRIGTQSEYVVVTIGK